MKFIHIKKPYTLNYNQKTLNPLNQFLLKSHKISHLKFITNYSLKFNYKKQNKKNISTSNFKKLKYFIINTFLNQYHNQFTKLLTLIKFTTKNLQKYINNKQNIIQTKSINNYLTILKKYLQNLNTL